VVQRRDRQVKGLISRRGVIERIALDLYETFVESTRPDWDR
jgi:hypothetical protein